MKFFRSQFAKFLFFILAFIVLEKLCRTQTGGFKTVKTVGDMPYNSAWEMSSFTQEQAVQEVLKQKFYFLGSGVQSYAFISEDGKSVLKLFKHYHMWPNTQLLRKVHLPFHLDGWCEKTIQEREKRMSCIFSSCKIAFEDCPEETGVYYLSLNLEKKGGSLTLIDKLGIAHTLDTKNTPFLLQKKAIPLFPYFSERMNKGKLEEAKRGIDSLLHLVHERLQKGVLNTDRKFCRNVGFIGDRAVHIDIGSFAKTNLDPKLMEEEAAKELHDFKEWLRKEYPSLLDHYETTFTTVFVHGSSL